jgi:hypothetical protein
MAVAGTAFQSTRSTRSAEAGAGAATAEAVVLGAAETGAEAGTAFESGAAECLVSKELAAAGAVEAEGAGAVGFAADADALAEEADEV